MCYTIIVIQINKIGATGYDYVYNVYDIEASVRDILLEELNLIIGFEYYTSSS